MFQSKSNLKHAIVSCIRRSKDIPYGRTGTTFAIQCTCKLLHTARQQPVECHNSHQGKYSSNESDIVLHFTILTLEFTHNTVASGILVSFHGLLRPHKSNFVLWNASEEIQSERQENNLMDANVISGWLMKAWRLPSMWSQHQSAMRK